MDAVFQALEAPRRRELLRQVWDVERGAGELRRAHPEVTFGAISQHLRVLERAGLVEARKLGRRRFYKARQDAVGPLLVWLEATWATGLQRLKLAAEREESSAPERLERRARKRPSAGPDRRPPSRRAPAPSQRRKPPASGSRRRLPRNP